MGLPDLSSTDRPLGACRDRFELDVSALTADYEDERGFVCEANGAGNLTFRTLHGSDDQSVTSLSAGDAIAVCGVPVILTAIVHGTGTTVASVVIGKL